MVTSPRFGQDGVETEEGIKDITDIPNYEKLLLAHMPSLPTNVVAPGNSINIGCNSGGNAPDSVLSNKQKLSEQIKQLHLKLASNEMTYKCRVLKKVIKSEEDEDKILSIVFNSDPKVIKKFLKRQQKCKAKKDRAPKTGLRQKML